jgi:hypothetical protein
MKPLITLHWVIEMQAFFVLLTKAEFTNPRGASVFVSASSLSSHRQVKGGVTSSSSFSYFEVMDNCTGVSVAWLLVAVLVGEMCIFSVPGLVSAENPPGLWQINMDYISFTLLLLTLYYYVPVSKLAVEISIICLARFFDAECKTEATSSEDLSC